MSREKALGEGLAPGARLDLLDKLKRVDLGHMLLALEGDRDSVRKACARVARSLPLAVEHGDPLAAFVCLALAKIAAGADPTEAFFGSRSRGRPASVETLRAKVRMARLVYITYELIRGLSRDEAAREFAEANALPLPAVQLAMQEFAPERTVKPLAAKVAQEAAAELVAVFHCGSKVSRHTALSAFKECRPRPGAAKS